MLNLDFSKPNTFKDSLYLLGFVTNMCQIDRKKASAFFGVSDSTLERWIYGAKPHPCAIRLIENKVHGIEQEGPFKGFSIDKFGNLVTPSGHIYSADFIDSVWAVIDNKNFYEATVNRLHREIDKLKTLSISSSKLADISKQIMDIANGHMNPDNNVTSLKIASQAEPERSEQFAG